MEIGRMSQGIIWHGTSEEALALLHALWAHCECRTDTGRTIAPCAGHRMLVHDQRAVDGLLFVRRIASRLLTEEFDVQPSPVADEPLPPISVRSAIRT
jgi:hypothetical protein